MKKYCFIYTPHIYKLIVSPVHSCLISSCALSHICFATRIVFRTCYSFSNKKSVLYYFSVFLFPINVYPFHRFIDDVKVRYFCAFQVICGSDKNLSTLSSANMS